MAVAFDINRPLPERAQQDLEGVSKNAGNLAELLEASANDRPGFSPSSVFGAIAAKLGITYQDVSRLFPAIDYLNEIKNDVGGVDKLFEFLEARLSPERARILASNRDNVRRLLNIYRPNHPLAISVKAERLGYLHQSLYQDAEIITDIRPVFDADGGSVVEMIISHSLVISHYSNGEPERLHLAMDAVDVQHLRDACERATTKARTLKSALAEGKSWAVKVLNERDADA